MKITNEVHKLHAELVANGGIVPDSWLPWLAVIKILLKLAELFTNDEVDKIIEEIIAAITIAESL
jgi:hypothetical protein